MILIEGIGIMDKRIITVSGSKGNGAKFESETVWHGDVPAKRIVRVLQWNVDDDPNCTIDSITIRKVER